MKKLNLGTAIYSLIASIILLFAPIILFFSITSEYEQSQQVAAAIAEGGNYDTNIIAYTQIINYIFMALAMVMVVLGIVNIIKVKQSNIVGMILIIIAGAIVIVFSGILGFIGGILGIVGTTILFVFSGSLGFIGGILGIVGSIILFVSNKNINQDNIKDIM